MTATSPSVTPYARSGLGGRPSPRSQCNQGRVAETIQVLKPSRTPSGPAYGSSACRMVLMTFRLVASSACANGSAIGPIWHAKLARSEEHTSELQSLMRISYAVFCLKKHKTIKQTH